jgi:hypothetical protein
LNSVRAGAPPLDAETLDALRAIQDRFGGEYAAKKAALLQHCSTRALDDPPALIAYHDILLFLLAYPEDRALLALAGRELRRAAMAARRIAEGGSERARRRLAGSGIAWSETSHAYSYEIAKWLALGHPRGAEINDEGGSDAPLRGVLRMCMPALEFELLAAEFGEIDAFLEEAKGASRLSNLAWLIEQLERLPCSDEAREHLFDSLELFVRIDPRDAALSRTFARGLRAAVFFHRRGLLRSAAQARCVLDEPLPSRRSVSRSDAKSLIDAARGILAMLGRETDPITLCTPEGVEYLELGRGVTIALYAMRPMRRFPLDTHLGFVLFKNAIPVGYGGGWPFFKTCRIGVNIFAPFRGGESAMLFCQVLRVYRRRFGTERFLVEPYQFGAGNREGLDSGAFWFYYRLGFRPLRSPLADLARAEFARMEAEAGYRPPRTVMRRLASSDIELRLSDDSAPSVDPYRLSRAVSEWIEREFEGDRSAAEHEAFRRASRVLGAGRTQTWPAGELRAFRALCPLIAMIPELARWSPRERRACLALMRAKGARDETRYFTLARRHRRLSEALARIAAGAAR